MEGRGGEGPEEKTGETPVPRTDLTMTKEQVQKWLRGLGCPEGVRCEAPDGGWVRLRPLTWRESLQREALACTEEFELDNGGVVRRVVRRFDAEEARRFDLRHCLIEWGGPDGNGGTTGLEAYGTGELAERLLDELAPETARWLEGCLDEINQRRPEDREALAEVKKS